MVDRYVPVVLMVVFAHYFACYCAADEAAGEVADTKMVVALDQLVADVSENYYYNYSDHMMLVASLAFAVVPSCVPAFADD